MDEHQPVGNSSINATQNAPHDQQNYHHHNNSNGVSTVAALFPPGSLAAPSHTPPCAGCPNYQQIIQALRARISVLEHQHFQSQISLPLRAESLHDGSIVQLAGAPYNGSTFRISNDGLSNAAAANEVSPGPAYDSGPAPAPAPNWLAMDEPKNLDSQPQASMLHFNNDNNGGFGLEPASFEFDTLAANAARRLGTPQFQSPSISQPPENFWDERFDFSQVDDSLNNSSMAIEPEPDFDVDFDLSAANVPPSPLPLVSTVALPPLARPMLASAPPLRFRCPHTDCGKDFRRQSDRTRHERTHDPNARRRFPCPVQGCDKSFPRNDNLRGHLQRRHRQGVANPSR